MLEGVVKGLLLWLYDLILQCVNTVGSVLLEVFSMDTAYFVNHAPVVLQMQNIFIGVGWALLLGNLAFQALRSMMAGIGLDAEDPKLLFAKSFLFAFLLAASPQICRLGLDLTSRIIALLKIPEALTIMAPEEAWFDFSGGWLLAIVAGLIMLFQVFKLFFEIGERYVVLNTLVFFAPLAFAMGGSKSTEDIFKGWARMFASMCVVMVSNVFFLKVVISALGTVPNTLTLIPWLIFVVGVCKVARRMDDILCRIGLNAAHTGREHIIPGAFTALALRSMAKIIQTNAQKNSGRPHGFGGFGGFGQGGRTGFAGNESRWGGTFGEPPKLPPVSLPPTQIRPGLPGPSVDPSPSQGPSGPASGPTPPTFGAGPSQNTSPPAGGHRSGPNSSQAEQGKGRSRPQAPHPRPAKPYRPASGNIDIWPDEDMAEAPNDAQASRPAAPPAPRPRAASEEQQKLTRPLSPKPKAPRPESKHSAGSLANTVMQPDAPATTQAQGSQGSRSANNSRGAPSSVMQQDAPAATRPPLQRSSRGTVATGRSVEKEAQSVLAEPGRSESRPSAGITAARTGRKPVPSQGRPTSPERTSPAPAPLAKGMTQPPRQSPGPTQSRPPQGGKPKNGRKP